ncbi:MAG: hypothetical protein F4077_04675 [Gammaproteobacteria bacterium]|nr:hypothetical protein [Gammaproteobacteria bacterium]MYI77041.1 hypothetical protein [Gammaproteobacteria bacterium]
MDSSSVSCAGDFEDDIDDVVLSITSNDDDYTHEITSTNLVMSRDLAILNALDGSDDNDVDTLANS